MRYDFYDIFKGFDETILDIVARKMNFTVKRVHPTDNKSFGYQLRNGTYVGAIGIDAKHKRLLFFSLFFCFSDGRVSFWNKNNRERRGILSF